MKKRLVLTVALIIGGLSFWFFAPTFKKSQPAVQTKFVLPEKSQDFIPRPDLKVSLKPSGDSALIPLKNHVYQTFNNCGPATLSMILAFYNINVSQQELGAKMRPFQNLGGDNDDKTIFTSEFVSWAQNYGLSAISRPGGTLDLLKQFTANGIPVVVKTWLKSGEDIGHFRIVKGFDEKEKVIIQDDSYQGPNKKFSYFDFLSIWQPFNYAYIIVYPKEKEEVVQTILGEDRDEKTAWEKTKVRAEKERELDPENIYPVFNLAASFYHLEKYAKSIQAFEEVESRLPRRMIWYQIEPILAYQKTGNFNRTLEIIEKILSNGNRAFAELYQIRGEIYLEQGKKDLARQEFEKAIFYNQNYQAPKKSLELL
ncbi:C39 family peptidase [Candidatus Microgenomates bacterium]|nr:C39 family peptidase [Candidatus Microgenomates bacterium]